MNNDVKPDPECFDQGSSLFSIWGLVVFGEPASNVCLTSFAIFIQFINKAESNIASPEVKSRSHIIDRIFVVQPAEGVLGVTWPWPQVQVTAPVNNNTEDATLWKHENPLKTKLFIHIFVL